MIANGYNSQTIQTLQQLQPPQPLQTIRPTQPKQQASPEDIKQTEICVQNWQNQLLNKNIISARKTNQLTIPISYNKSIISVHCASLGRYRIPNHHYVPRWVYVNRETFNEYPADIYLSYNPFTLQPEGFTLRGQLSLTEPPGKPGVWVYGIMREALDPNIDKLFDLNYLFKTSQFESISYV